MFRIAFYFNDFNTLGHTTIVFSLIKAMKNTFGEKVRIKVFQDGNKAGLFPLRRYAQVLPLSCYALDKNGSPTSDGKTIFKKRLIFLKEELKGFSPDIFITEYLPFSRRFLEYELRYWLQYIKERFNCKVISSCTYPNVQKHTLSFLRDFYDGVFFHFPRSFLKGCYSYMPQQARPFLKSICREFSGKIFFTGFILDKKALSGGLATAPAMPQEEFILISRGGRLENKKVIISAMLLARKKPSLQFLISCGPFINRNEFEELLILSKDSPNVRLVKYIPPQEFELCLKRCSLSINMAGYNTVARLLYFKKKSVMIPFNNNEQEWLASAAGKYLSCRIIGAGDCSVSSLGRAIDALLGTPRAVKKAVSPYWFNGGENTARMLSRWA